MPAMLVAFTLFLIPMTMTVCSDSDSGELYTIRCGLLLLLVVPVTMGVCLGSGPMVRDLAGVATAHSIGLHLISINTDYYGGCAMVTWYPFHSQELYFRIY